MRTAPAPIIENEEDLATALARLSEIFDAERGTPEGDEFEVLATMIESYERKSFPLSAPNPVAAIRFAMEQRGYTYADLVKAVGSSSRASDIMNGRRALTLRVIRRLQEAFKIPLSCLISDTPPPSLPKQRPGRKPALAVGETSTSTYGRRKKTQAP